MNDHRNAARGLPRTHRIAAAIAGSLLFYLLVMGQASFAQQRVPSPYLRGIYPPGGKPGATVNTTLAPGEFLDGANRLLFSHPGITAAPRMREADKFYPEPRPIENEFVISIGTAVPPGVYDVRAAIGGKLSNARKFVVEPADATLEEEPNDELTNANPIGPTGIVYGAFERGYDTFRFALQQGERVLLSCEADRIDSLGDAVLVVFDAQGRELARSQNVAGRDPVIDFVAPTAADYHVRVSDLTFGNETKSEGTPYRVTIDRTPWIAFADPPILVAGTATQVTLFGHNLGGTPSQRKLAGKPLEQVTVSITAPANLAMQPVPAELKLHPATGSVDFFAYRHSGPTGQSQPIPLAVADGPLIAEAEPNDTVAALQAVALPLDLLGHFDSPGDTDRYVFSAKRGDKLWIEAISEQLGAPTAPIVALGRLRKDEAGKPRIDDLRPIVRERFELGELRPPIETEDPARSEIIPADGEYVLTIKDAFGTAQGGPRSAYRLRCGAGRPDFRVLALVDAEVNSENNNLMRSRAGLVRRGGAVEVLIVPLRRDGFPGEITVSLESPPAGLSAEPIVIGPSQHFGELAIRAAADAPAFSGPLKIVARAKLGEAEVVRPAKAIEILSQHSNQNVVVPARLTSELSISVDDSAVVPARIEEVSRQIWRMARGGKLEIPVKLVASDGKFTGSSNPRVIGMPRGVQANVGGMTAGGGETKLTVDLQTEVPPGKFTLHLRGDTEIDYRREPALAERAEQDHQRLQKLQQESEQAEQQSRQMREQAEQAAREAENQRNQLRDAQQRTKQQTEQTEQEAKQLAEKATAAKQAVDGASAEQLEQAKAQYEAAEKQSQEKQAQLKAAGEELAKATAALDEAEQKLTAAQQAQMQMQTAEAQARKDRELAARMRQEAEQTANRWRQVSQPQRYRLPIQSTPIVIEVVPYPIALKVTPAATTVKAGEKVLLNVEATREFGFQEEVTLSIRPPEDFAGPPYFEPINKLEKGQNAAQLPLVIQPISKPGNYTFQVRAYMVFNGRGLEMDMPLTLSIEAKPVE